MGDPQTAVSQRALPTVAACSSELSSVKNGVEKIECFDSLLCFLEISCALVYVRFFVQNFPTCCLCRDNPLFPPIL